MSAGQLLEGEPMKEVVECAMNVSEGRDKTKLEAIAGQIEDTPEAFLLGYSADPAHHRTVFTFIGNQNAIIEAAFRAGEKAVQLIDLRVHKGVHPRIGAVDVIPFVPLQGVNMHDCVQIAHRLARRIAGDLHVPAYLYAEAAIRAGGRDLSSIRRGEFEGLSDQVVSDLARQPDYGSNRLHPTAGAVAVGARPILIAYNIFLDTSELEVARRIAVRIRESSGGLPGVKALGFYIDYRDLAQVSTNVVDYQQTSLSRVFEGVQREARRLETDVLSSEIVGLVPQAALERNAPEILKLEGFDSNQILENRITEVFDKKRRALGEKENSTKRMG